MRESYRQQSAQLPHKSPPPGMPPPYNTAEGSENGRRPDHRNPFVHPQTPLSGYGDRRLPNSIDAPRRGSGGGGGGGGGGRRSVEASPRDINMIDHGGYAQRRIGRDNDRPDDRYRGRSRRDSVDRLYGAASSTGGRTPSDTGIPLHAPSPTMSAHSTGPQQMLGSGPAADSSTNASTILAISEASFTYFKLQEARKKYDAARMEKNKHEEHFTNFPVMRERYGGALVRAEEDLRKAEEDWSVKGIQGDTQLKNAMRLQTSPKDVEAVALRVFETALRKDIGPVSLDQFIEEAVREKISNSPAITALLGDMKALKEREQQTSKELAELSTFCKTSLGSLEKSMDALKKDVLDAQQLAVVASDAMQQLDGLKARVDRFEEDMKTVASMLSEAHSELQERKSQQEELQRQFSEKLAAPPEPIATASDVTKEDLEENTRILKKYVENAIGFMADECEECRKATEKSEASMAKLNADLNETAQKQHAEYTEGINRAVFQINSIQHNVTLEVTDVKTRLKRQEDTSEALKMAVTHCDNRLTDWSTKDYYENVASILQKRNPNFMATVTQVAHLTHQYQLLANQYQALANWAKMQQPQRMVQPRENGSVNQDVAGRLNNPNNANTNGPGQAPSAAELENVTKGLREMGEKILGDKTEIIEKISSLERLIEGLRVEVEAQKKQSDDQEDNFQKRMRDIVEWSRGVVDRLSEQHDNTQMAKDDIARIMQRLRTSGSPGDFTVGGAMRGSQLREELKPLASGDEGHGAVEEQ